MVGYKPIDSTTQVPNHPTPFGCDQSVGAEPFTVDCHAGYRGEERPLRFGVKGERMVEVVEILRWTREEGFRTFRVRGDDGATWLLRHDEGSGDWTALRC